MKNKESMGKSPSRVQKSFKSDYIGLISSIKCSMKQKALIMVFFGRGDFRKDPMCNRRPPKDFRAI